MSTMPSSPLRRDRPQGCLSDLVLDELLAGELPEGAPDPRPHLASCGACAARYSAFEAERDALAGTLQDGVLPFEAAADEPVSLAAHRARKGRLALVATTLAAAAALALVALWPRPDEGAIRLKGGGDSLSLWVERGGALEVGGPGERLHPGEILHFGVSLAEDRHVAVLSVDGAGTASAYFPPNAATTQPMSAGAWRRLPMATRLDAVLGAERLYGLFCAQPTALRPLLDALARDPSAPPPPGCTLERVDVVKVAP